MLDKRFVSVIQRQITVNANGLCGVLDTQGVIYLKRCEWVKAGRAGKGHAARSGERARFYRAGNGFYRVQGKVAQAIPPLERSLKINPARSETHWTLAKAYFSHEQYDAALKESQEALAESRGASAEIEL